LVFYSFLKNNNFILKLSSGQTSKMTRNWRYSVHSMYFWSRDFQRQAEKLLHSGYKLFYGWTASHFTRKRLKNCVTGRRPYQRREIALTNCDASGDSLLSDSQLFVRRLLVTNVGIKMHVDIRDIVCLWRPSHPNTNIHHSRRSPFAKRMCALDKHRTARVPPLRTSTAYRNWSIWVSVRVNSTELEVT
jgi:hypothetical protein